MDDTLVETSKCLTPERLKEALSLMIEAGLKITNREDALQDLIAINEKALSSTLALPIFCEKYGANKEILEIGLASLFTLLPENLVLPPVPGAIDLLKDLYKDYELALVTLGQKDLQLQKLKKAGIQPQYFSKIIVGQGKNKKAEYEQILKEFRVKPQETFVCGDRVPVDLTPAKELGMKTIHFVNGRGHIFKDSKKDIDFSIFTLSELKKILTKSFIYERKSSFDE